MIFFCKSKVFFVDLSTRGAFVIFVGSWCAFTQLFGSNDETTGMGGNQITANSGIFAHFRRNTLQSYSIEILLQLDRYSISAKKEN